MGRRVLLLNDDYNENSQLETILKKIGFDTMGLGSEQSLADKILGFRPDLVIASGQTSQVSSVSVGMKLREMRGFSGSVILGFPKAVKLSTQEMLRVRLDRIQESPFDMPTLIRNICELLLLDTESHLEKLRKSSWTEEEQKLQIIRGPHVQAPETGKLLTPEAEPPEAVSPTVPPTPERLTYVSPKAAEERQARFEKALGGLDIKLSDTTFHRAAVRDKWAEVKKDWNFETLEELKEQKKDFAKALFEDVKEKTSKNSGPPGDGSKE